MDDRTRHPLRPPVAARSPRRALAHGLLAVAVLAGGLWAGWGLLTSEPEVGRRPPAERSARLVQTVPARVADHPVPVTAWGELRPSRELQLTPRVGGRVVAVHPDLEPGAVVAAGTELLRLDPEPFQVDLRRARTALTRAQADRQLEQGQQTVARREYQLLEGEVGEAERALILRRPQLATAQAAVDAAEADVADARRALAQTRLRAPFDALVGSVEVAPGAELSAGTGVARLIGVDTWWLELAVPVGALQWIRFPGDPGGEASAVELAYPGVWPQEARRSGRLLRLLGELETDGRLARVLVAVDDPLARGAAVDGPRLLAGSFLRARIQGRVLEDAVALEPGWLRPEDTVWVMDADGRLAIRPVTVAHRGADRVLLSAGLADGERIVTSPLALPAEGMPLRSEDSSGGTARDP